MFYNCCENLVRYSYDCYPIIVYECCYDDLLYNNRTNGVRQSYEYFTAIVRMLYNNHIQMLYDNRTNVVQPSCECHTIIVRMLYDSRTILYDNCTNIVQQSNIVRQS